MDSRLRGNDGNFRLIEVSSCYGNTNPDRAFTAEMSEELIAPDAFTSNMKFKAPVACPERAFTALMSLELTERVLFTSPTRKPIAADALTAAALMLVSATVARWLSGTPVSDTTTSLPGLAGIANVAEPTAIELASIELTPPTDVTGPLNWKTML